MEKSQYPARGREGTLLVKGGEYQTPEGNNDDQAFINKALCRTNCEDAKILEK